jgi:hypothetical protein
MTTKFNIIKKARAISNVNYFVIIRQGSVCGETVFDKSKHHQKLYDQLNTMFNANIHKGEIDENNTVHIGEPRTVEIKIMLSGNDYELKQLAHALAKQLAKI